MADGQGIPAPGSELLNAVKAPASPAEAVGLQRSLAAKVVRRDDLPGPIRTVAGVDVAFPDGGRVTRAAVILCGFPDLSLIDQATFEMPTAFPYIPGLLSFRELPAILPALRKLTHPADLVLCDGQGIAHPRRFGIACHLGVITGLPAIGIGKSRLCGTHREPGPERGQFSWLIDQGERIGMVLRTRKGTAPLYVSTGHRVGPSTARRLVLACTPRFRLPEPIRQADRLAGQS